jgi:hypothetical protein
MVQIQGGEHMYQEHMPMPVKVEQAIEAPPGLAPPSNAQTSTSDEYSLGEQVLALRSDGSWSLGKVAEITDDKVTVVCGNGVKQVRKEKLHMLLRKVDKADSQPLKEAALMSQHKMALEAENCRLVHENMMMRMQACTQGTAASMMQDPHGYMCNPWGIPAAACPPSQDEGNWLVNKVLSKVNGQKNRKTKNGKTAEDSWGSASVTTGCGSIGMSSLGTASMGAASWGAASWGTMTTGTASASLNFGGEKEPVVHNALADTLPHERTTVMMRNIPNNVTREQLLKIIDEEGFQGAFDLLYLPVDLKNKVGLGYALVNFVSNEKAVSFSEYFTGFSDWKMQSEKVCAVKWSDALQGLEEHVERYRDCPVMHESIPDEFKPVLFKDGERVPFPEPTKRIRAPRPWSRRN